MKSAAMKSAAMKSAAMKSASFAPSITISLLGILSANALADLPSAPLPPDIATAMDVATATTEQNTALAQKSSIQRSSMMKWGSGKKTATNAQISAVQYSETGQKIASNPNQKYLPELDFAPSASAFDLAPTTLLKLESAPLPPIFDTPPNPVFKLEYAPLPPALEFSPKPKPAPITPVPVPVPIIAPIPELTPNSKPASQGAPQDVPELDSAPLPPAFEPVSIPVPVPIVEPIPAPQPAPIVEPVPVSIPAPIVEPVPVSIPAPQPAPIVEPIPEPIPAPQPAPIVEPIPAPIPAPQPAPIIEPIPEPTSVLEFVPLPTPAPKGESAPLPKSFEPEIELESTPKPALKPKSTPVPATEPESATKPEPATRPAQTTIPYQPNENPTVAPNIPPAPIPRLPNEKPIPAIPPAPTPNSLNENQPLQDLPASMVNASSLMTSASPTGISVYETMQAVLRHSPSLDSIRQSRHAQVHEVRKARSGYLPSVDLSSRTTAGIVDNNTSRTTFNGDNFATTGQVGINATQILWNGRAVAHSVEFNIFRVESLDHRIYDNATYLALEGLIAHIDLLRSKDVLALADQYVQVHREILEMQDSLRDAGVTTAADVSQSQGRLSRALSTQNSARNALQVAIVNYQKLTGQPVPPELAAAVFPHQQLSTPEAMVGFALWNNPKIRALSSDASAARSQTKLAKSPYHPQVMMTMGTDYSDPNMSKANNLQSWTAGMGVGMRWNVYGGGATTNATQAAQAREVAANRDIAAMRDTVSGDLNTTHANLLFAQDQIKTLEEMLAYNLKTRDEYMAQHKFGTRRLLDLLDAEGELFNTQTQLLTFQSNAIINTWKILALQGVLLREFGAADNKRF